MLVYVPMPRVHDPLTFHIFVQDVDDGAKTGVHGRIRGDILLELLVEWWLQTSAKPNSSMTEEDFLNKNSDKHSTLW